MRSIKLIIAILFVIVCAEVNGQAVNETQLPSPSKPVNDEEHVQPAGPGSKSETVNVEGRKVKVNPGGVQSLAVPVNNEDKKQSTGTKPE